MERTQWIDVCFFPITCETVTTICLCELTFTLWNLQSTLKPSKKSRIKKKNAFLIFILITTTLNHFHLPNTELYVIGIRMKISKYRV